MLDLKLTERERAELLRILEARRHPDGYLFRSDEEISVMEKIRNIPYKEHRT